MKTCARRWRNISKLSSTRNWTCTISTLLIIDLPRWLISSLCALDIKSEICTFLQDGQLAIVTYDCSTAAEKERPFATWQLFTPALKSCRKHRGATAPCHDIDRPPNALVVARTTLLELSKTSTSPPSSTVVGFPLTNPNHSCYNTSQQASKASNNHQPNTQKHEHPSQLSRSPSNGFLPCTGHGYDRTNLQPSTLDASRAAPGQTTMNEQLSIPSLTVPLVPSV